mgnify:CR=1 FL=1
MHSMQRTGWSRVAAVTAVLMMPSLARADAYVAAPEEDPFAEDGGKSDGDAEKSDGGEKPADDGDAGSGDEAPDILNKDLADQVPQPEWVYEGEGSGKSGGVEIDPRLMNRKIRRAGRVTLAGAGIALLGGVIAISGVVMLYGVQPQSKLSKLKSSNNGVLPVDDDKRHKYIDIARAGPIVAFTGLGILAAGVITAAIARVRLKKLREQRRTSIIAVTPTRYGQGAELTWEVRF